MSPLMQASLLLYLTVWFDGVPIEHCLIDTGAEPTILARSAAASLGTLSAPIDTLRLRSTLGGAETVGIRYTVPNVGTPDIGWPWAEVIIVPDAALPVDTPCIIGTTLLARQPVMIDFRQHRLLRGDP